MYWMAFVSIVAKETKREEECHIPQVLELIVQNQLAKKG